MEDFAEDAVRRGFDRDLPSDPTMSYVSESPTTDPVALPTPTEGLTSWGILVAEAAGEELDAEPLTQGKVASLFQLHRRLGRGGFGEVWEATQKSLNRIVAIKRIQDVKYDQMRTREERTALEWVFRQEAYITAQLDHPNIIPVHDLGLDDKGRPLLAMKLVEGENWAEVIIREVRQFPVEEFLSRQLPILLSMAQAVAFAHSRGIVHRDLKPSQVMVGRFGEVLLVDWGLAVHIPGESTDPAHAISRMEELPTRDTARNPAGTPALMAPEQTRMSADSITFQTDVFLLGGILYFLLCGHFPHDALTTRESVAKAISCEIEDPRLRSPDRPMPGALVELAMQCLQKRPADRLASAEEFIARLRDYLRGESNRRDSLGITESVEREFLARFGSTNNDQADRLAAATAAERYETLADLLNRLDHAGRLWGSNPDLDRIRGDIRRTYAELAIVRGDLTLARMLVRDLPDLEGGWSLRQRLDAAERGLARQRSQRLFALASATVLLVGLLLVSFIAIQNQRASNLRLLQERDRAERARQNAEHAERDAVAHSIAADAARQAAEREHYFSSITLADVNLTQGNASRAREMLINRSPAAWRGWEWGHLMAQLHKETISLVNQAQMFHADWSPDGTRIVTGDFNHVAVWEAATGRQIWRRATNDYVVWTTIFSPDGTRILACSFDQSAVLLDAETGRRIRQFSGHTNILRGGAFSPDGSLIATTGQDRSVIVWSVEDGRQLFRKDDFEAAVYNATFSPDGRIVVACSLDGQVVGWNAHTGAQAFALPRQTGGVNTVIYTDDARHLVTSSRDGFVRIYDAETFEPVRSFSDDPPAWLHTLDVSPDGRLVAGGGEDGVCRIWDLETGEPLARFLIDDPIWKTRFSPDGGKLLTTSRFSVRIFETARVLALPAAMADPPLDEIQSLVQTVAVFAMPAARQQTWAERSNAWLTPSGFSRVETETGSAWLVHSRYTRMSPDRELVAQLDPNDLTVKVRNLRSGTVLARFEDLQAIDHAFSPDGRWLAIMEFDRIVRLIDTASWTETRRFIKDPDRILAGDRVEYKGMSMAFSPDSTLLAGGFINGRVCLWDVESGREIRELSDVGGVGISLAFSADGKLLAAGGNQDLAGVWDVGSGEQLQVLRGHNRSIFTIIFSPDASRIVTIADDRTAKLWDTATGREILTLTTGDLTRQPLGAAFGADGIELIVVFNDGRVDSLRPFPWHAHEYPGDETLGFEHRFEWWKRLQRTGRAIDLADVDIRLAPSRLTVH
jgi:WD40 repeat protein/serine/threonine protein kinase